MMDGSTDQRIMDRRIMNRWTYGERKDGDGETMVQEMGDGAAGNEEEGKRGIGKRKRKYNNPY